MEFLSIDRSGYGGNRIFWNPILWDVFVTNRLNTQEMIRPGDQKKNTLLGIRHDLISFELDRLNKKENAIQKF